MLVKASTLLAGMILNGEYQSVKGEWSTFIQGTVHTGILQYVALMYTYSSGDPNRILYFCTEFVGLPLYWNTFWENTIPH